MFLPDIWATHAKWRPTRDALVVGDQRLNWRQINAAMNRVANALTARGLGRGDMAALVLGNTVETLAIMGGVIKAGLGYAPLSSLVTPDTLKGMIANADSRLVFVAEAYRGMVEPMIGTVEGVAADGWIGVDFTGAGWTSFAEFERAAAETEPFVERDLDDIYNIIYSSGTTGVPKGIRQSHYARHHFAYSNALEMCFTQHSRILTTTALYSNGTQLMALPAMLMGSCLVVMEKFEPRALLETIERERITHTLMVPTQYISVLSLADHDRYDTSSLQVMLTAGSPMRPDTRRAIIDRFGPVLHELYGFSEGAASMIKPDMIEEKWGSVGVPVIGFDTRIVGPDDKELPRGEVGEICSYGSGMLLAYHKAEDKTEELVWRDEHGRTYLRTGDIGKLDEDGYLYVLDRKKDMIISGGFNVFPVDIEEIMGEHPDIEDVTVIGVPHKLWGESALAMVIPRAGAATTPEEIRDWANGRLGKTQRLVDVRFKEDFPRNALGKVLKRSLRDELSGEEWG